MNFTLWLNTLGINWSNIFYIILFGLSSVVVFLWGRAIGTNETCEEYKLQDKKEEVSVLRIEVEKLRYAKKTIEKECLFYKTKYHSIKQILD